MQEKTLGEFIFARIHAGPVFALARIQEYIFEGSFPHISQILEGIHFGTSTCRACICTCAITGEYFWRIIYVLVSCQGVIASKRYHCNSNQMATSTHCRSYLPPNAELVLRDLALVALRSESRSCKCPKSVPRVSPECQKGVPDTPGTLSGHFLDTPEAGARRAPGTPCRTLSRTPPIFGDTLGDTPGTVRARRARETPAAGRRDRKHRIAEWLARVDRVCRTLAIGDRRVCPSKTRRNTRQEEQLRSNKTAQTQTSWSTFSLICVTSACFLFVLLKALPSGS